MSIGRHTYHAPDLKLKTWHREIIEIGSFCSIAEEVTIMAGGKHRVDTASTFPFEQVMLGMKKVDRSVDGSGRRRTTIGNDVWIGVGATILSDARVGHGAVIGAKAVVHGRVPPYAVVSGNPAEILYFRHAPDVVEKLLQIKWWDWPDAEIARQLEWFYKPAREFVEHFAK